MAYDAGVAFLSVQPSFEGVVKAIGAQAKEWGTEAGTIFKESFENQVGDLNIAVGLNGVSVVKAASEVDALTKDRTVAIDPSLSAADAAATAAKLDLETRDRTVHIKPEVDGGGLGLLSALLGGAGLGGLGGLLGKAPGGALGGLGIAAGVAALLGVLPAILGLVGGVAAAFAAAGLAASAFGAVAFMAVTAALKGGAGMDPWLAHLRTQLLSAEAVFGAFWDKMTKMELPIISKIVGQWVSATTQILPAFEPLIKAGGVGMEAFTKNLLPAFTNPAFKQFLAQMAKAAPGVMGAGGKGLANLGEGMANLLQGFLPMVGVVDKGFVSMTKSFKTWAMSLTSSQGFKNFIADAKKTLPEVAKLFGYVAAGVFSVVGFLVTLGVITGSALGAVVKWVGMVVKSIVGWYDHMTGLNQFVSRALSSIATGFGNAVGFISQLIGGLVSWLKAHWTQIAADAEIAWNIVSTAIKIVWEVITTIISWALKNVIIPILAAAWQDIFHGVTLAWTIITTALKIIIGALIQVFYKISDVIGFLTGVWKTVTSDIHTAWDAVTTWFKGLPGRIVSAIGDAKTLLFNVGKDIIQGLWNGITSVAGWLQSKISGLAGNVVNWAKGVLGIHSPSLVFHQMGLDIGQGLANGILASTSAVTAAGRGMLSGLTGTSLTASVGLVGGGFSPSSINLSGATAGGPVLTALQRIESAVLGVAPATGAAVSTKVDAKLANVITQHAKTSVMLSRTGA